MYPNPKFRDRSFFWVFGVFLLLITAGAFWGGWIGMSFAVARFAVGVAGFIPVGLLLATGYSFDGTWTAQYPCTERPVRFWCSVAATAAIGVLVAVAAFDTPEDKLLRWTR